MALKLSRLSELGFKNCRAINSKAVLCEFVYIPAHVGKSVDCSLISNARRTADGDTIR